MRDIEKFAIKELYEATLKATRTMVVGNHTFQPGEVVLSFKNLSVANINTPVNIAYSRGGEGNPWVIIYDHNGDSNFEIQTGVLDKYSFSILNGNNFAESNSLSVPYNKEVTVSGSNNIVLNKKINIDLPIFIYINNLETYELVTDYTVTEETGTISFTGDYSGHSAVINCYIDYEDGASQFTIGLERLQGYFKFEAKAYYKDENAGLLKTILITAPQVQIVNDFKLYLGEKAIPIVSNLVLLAKSQKLYNGAKDISFTVDMLDSDLESSF